MLDPDISTEDALHLLSRPDLDDEPVGPQGWTRRTFLQAIGAGVFGGAAVGTIAGEFFGGDIPEAWAGTPIGANDGIVVVVTLYGGYDGLNTFVPFGDGNYYTRRANIAIPQNQVLAVNGSVGFAPQLTYLKTLYDAGQVAAIQGTGYANPDLSHFTSMAIWMNGRFGGGPPSTGWVGRWLDGQPAGVADLAAASLDTSVPLHMQGVVRRAAGIPPNGGMFGFDNQPSDQRMYAGLRAMSNASGGRGTLFDTFNSTMRRQLDLANEVAPTFRAALPGGGELTRELTIAARLINANLGLRVFDVSRGGFDTHDNQNGALPGLLVDLNAGLQAFFATLQPQWQNRVTLLVMSRVRPHPGSNNSGGTDHGTSNTSFVIGTNVRGGLYGQMPSLTSLDRNGRMLSYVDFRWIYGIVARRLARRRGEHHPERRLREPRAVPRRAGCGVADRDPGGPRSVGRERLRVDRAAARLRHPRRHRRSFDAHRGRRVVGVPAGRPVRHPRRRDRGRAQPHRGRRHGGHLRLGVAGRHGQAVHRQPQPGAGHGRAEPRDRTTGAGGHAELLQQLRQREPGGRRGRLVHALEQPAPPCPHPGAVARHS